MMSTPDWLVPGAACVVLQDWNWYTLRAENAVVDRVLKRDVVVTLTSGKNKGQEERFNAQYLTRRIGGDWGHETKLVQPSDPKVAKVRAAIRLSRAKDLARLAVSRWERNEVDTRSVAAAFTALADVEDSQ